MNELKGWRTVIFNLIAMVASLGALYGVDITPEQQASIGGGIISILTVGNLILRKATTTPMGKQSGFAQIRLVGLILILSGLVLLVTSCSLVAAKPNQIKIWTSEEIDLLSAQLDMAEKRNWISSDDEIRFQKNLKTVNLLLLPGAIPDATLCPDVATAAECRLIIIQAAEAFYLEHKHE